MTLNRVPRGRMTAEQKSALTELVALKHEAMLQTIYHENEAARYRKQYRDLTTASIAIRRDISGRES